MMKTQQERIKAIRDKVAELDAVIRENLKDSTERTNALAKTEEVLMISNLAISVNG
jgi:hypothetical protein